MSRMTHRNENGMASIMVAAVVMIIMSLITIGFARLMGRESRQALDRQLSTQAFYAAESAINDTRASIAADPGAASAKPDCDVNTNHPYVQSDDGIIDAGLNIRYTCLIVNPVVPSLEFDNGTITQNTPRIGRVESSTGEVIDRINLSWEGVSPSLTAFGACGTQNNPTSASWTSTDRPALLRVDIIPAAALNRDALINNTRSLYLYPCAGAGGTVVLGTAAGQVAPHGDNRFNVGCDANRVPRDCTITVSGLAAFNSSRFYVRLSTFYRSANASVSAANSSGSVLSLRNGQVLIDATGRSNDVLRRIVVRVPITDDGGMVNAGVSSTDSFCKLFTLGRDANGSTNVPDPGAACL